MFSLLLFSRKFTQGLLKDFERTNFAKKYYNESMSKIRANIYDSFYFTSGDGGSR